jgi:hypothetical protein
LIPLDIGTGGVHPYFRLCSRLTADSKGFITMCSFEILNSGKVPQGITEIKEHLKLVGHKM